MGEIPECFKHRCLASNFGHPRIQTGLAGRFKINKLVDEQVGNDGAGYAVESVDALLPTFHRFPMCGPKVGGEGDSTRIKEIPIVQCFVILVVIGCQTQGPRFNPHVDVF